MRRSRKCTLDALEGRELLSLTPILGLLAPKVVASAPAGSVAAAQDVTGGNGGSPSTSTIPSLTDDQATPRPGEAAARVFRGTFSGRVQQRAPRLVDQQRQYYFVLPGNTNQFLHGTLQMRLYTPSASAAAPFNVNLGTFSISDRSTQSGGVILADLAGAVDQVDAKGRPTSLTFNVNGGGGSGGIYASSVGGGTVDITYKGNVAKVLVRGSIFRQGIGEPLDIYQTNLQRSL